MESPTRVLTMEAPAPMPVARPRLSEALFGGRSRGFDSIAVFGANVRAVESAIRFGNGLNPFVAIIGPSGWGKSHLLEAAARQFSLESGNIVLASALDWLADPKLRSYNGPLILDNVQDLTSRTRSRLQLRLALERRIKAKRPTLLSFTEGKATRTIRRTLPIEREWVIATLKAPSGAEREKVVDVIANAERMRLSGKLSRLLAHEMEGNGRTLSGALNRLKLTQLEWTTPRETLLACGLLNPLFAANPKWDLRETIADAAQNLSTDERAHVTPFDLSIFIMLKVAGLGETDVAKFFRLEPGKAYGYANRFGQKVDSNERVEAIVERFIGTVVASL